MCSETETVSMDSTKNYMKVQIGSIDSGIGLLRGHETDFLEGGGVSSCMGPCVLKLLPWPSVLLASNSELISGYFWDES